MAYKKYDTYKKAEEAVKKLGGSDKYFILKPELDGPYQVAPRKDFTPDKKANGGMANKGKKGTRSGLAKYRKKENMTDAEARKKLFDQLDAEAKRYGKEPTPNKKADGGMMNKKLTKTVPPKKGPNSQGMRGTGSAIRGTKFKGVF